MHMPNHVLNESNDHSEPGAVLVAGASEQVINPVLGNHPKKKRHALEYSLFQTYRYVTCTFKVFFFLQLSASL